MSDFGRSVTFPRLSFLQATHQVTYWLVGCAWAYVALRYAQTWMHLTRNDVVVRFSLYFASGAVLVVMWVTLLVQLVRGDA